MRRGFLLAVAFALILFSSYMLIQAEGGRVLTLVDKSTIIVPEECPDFTHPSWRTVGTRVFDFSGGSCDIVVRVNMDSTVVVSTVHIRSSKLNGTIVAFAVRYKVNPNQHEYYEDPKFVETGVPSGVFVKCPIGTTRSGDEYTKWLIITGNI
jgi:hypothetical protein